MNIIKHEKSNILVRPIKYRIDMGCYNHNSGICDLDNENNPGSINCIKCEHCVEDDHRNYTIFCSYIDGELERQKKLIDDLQAQIYKEFNELVEIIKCKKHI